MLTPRAPGVNKPYVPSRVFPRHFIAASRAASTPEARGGSGAEGGGGEGERKREEGGGVLGVV